MQLEPQSEFVLARGLEDHTDAGTYYVRAVIRNAKTDALIDTVNLTDNGNRRFTKAWRVPADPTGEGFDVLVIYTVYTDSGYTTKSSNYGEKFDSHRIEHIPRHGGGGGGVDVDYKKVREIIQEELATLPPPTEPTAPTDLRPVLDTISAFRKSFAALDIPEAKEVVFTPVLARFDTLEKRLEAIRVPAPDLSGVEFRLQKQEELLEAAELARFADDMKALFEKMRQFYGHDMDQINSKLDELTGVLKKAGMIVQLPTINQTE